MTGLLNMRRTYQVTGTILLCLAVYVGHESLALRYYTPLGPGPGFFAFWLALILGVLAVSMVAQATFGRPEPVPPDFLADRRGYLLACLKIPYAERHLGAGCCESARRFDTNAR